MFTTKPEVGRENHQIGWGGDAKTPFTERPATYASKSPGPSASKMVPSIIGEDLTIRGNVTSKGEIQVDGEIEGDIRCGSLLVGDKSRVTGGVVAEDIVVRGQYCRIDHGLAHYAPGAMPCGRRHPPARALPSSRVPISKESHAAPTIHSRI